MSVLRAKSRSTGAHPNSSRVNNSRLRFGQGLPNLAFFKHVYSLLSGYCSVDYYTSSVLNKSISNIDIGYFFNTMTLPCFNYLYNIFHVNGIKVVPAMIYDLLTPVGLAYLIMGDGSFHRRDGYVVICTEGFTTPDNLLLMSVLINKFELSCRAEKHKNSIRIVIRRSSMDLLRSLTLPHMIPEMKYRVGA